jgi:hypothetical protein
MEHAGMVHALEKIHSLLKPDGVLIDIHPTGEPASIEIRVRDRVTLAGWLQETDDYVEYEWANEALNQIVRSGLFTVERQSVFTFNTYAASIAELRDHLAEAWKDAILDEITAARAEELLNTIERDKEVIVHESVYIAQLRPRFG